MDIDSIRIGASEAAPALGLSPYETRLEWYAKKVGFLDRDDDNEATVLGRALEGGLGDLFASSHKVPIVKGSSFTHPSVPWMAATPDYLIEWDSMTAAFKQLVSAQPGEVVLLEIKTTGLASWRPVDVINRDWGEHGSHDIPVSYAAQVQQQIAVVDAALKDAGIGFCRRAFVKALLPGRGAPEFVVDGDKDVSRFISQRLHEMVEHHLVPEIPPDPEGAEDWLIREQMIARPFREKKRRAATPDEEALVVDWRRAKKELEVVKERVARTRTLLIERLGDSYGIDLSFGRVLYTGGKESARLRKAAAFDEVKDWALSDPAAPPAAAAFIQQAMAKHTKAMVTGRRLVPHFKDEEDTGESE